MAYHHKNYIIYFKEEVEMKAKKVMALVLCAAMVSGLAATTVMAAPEDQFDGLKANEAGIRACSVWQEGVKSPF